MPSRITILPLGVFLIACRQDPNAPPAATVSAVPDKAIYVAATTDKATINVALQQ